jgi:hypothetical protein
MMVVYGRADGMPNFHHSMTEHVIIAHIFTFERVRACDDADYGERVMVRDSLSMTEVVVQEVTTY